MNDYNEGEKSDASIIYMVVSVLAWLVVYGSFKNFAITSVTQIQAQHSLKFQ